MAKYKNIIKEYFATIIVSLLIIAILCMGIELELMFRCEKNVNYNELNVENLSKFCTIEELEKNLVKNPDDFILNIRLGVLYEGLGKLDKANDYYKNALKLSGRSNFALYSYAMFCARNNMYVFAATLAEELSGNNKKTNLLKAKIYEQIGDSLDSAKQFAPSVKSYQIVYKYAKSIGDLKYINSIKTKYANEYVKLADYNMENGETLESISNLKNSLKIKKTPIANYKLGLILSTDDPYNAEKYMNSAFFKDPFIVNPYIYNSLLQKQLDEAKITSNGSLINYYTSRLTRFKKKVSEVYLYKNQVLVDNSTLITKKTLFNKIKHILFFEIKNNTKEELNNLFMKVEFYVNGKKYVVEKKIISHVNPLPPYEILQYQDLIMPDNIEFNNLKQNNDIFVRYFAKKTDEAPWVLIKIDFLDI